jgi:transposase
MGAVLQELGLADLVTTIAGLTVTGAAAILAETGDPARFASSRALVKHAQRLWRRPGQDVHFRARPALPAGGRLAGGLGSDAENPVMAATSRMSMGSPARLLTKLDSRCRETNPLES